MFLLLLTDDFRDDLEIIRDVLLNAKDLSSLDNDLIKPVAKKLKRYEGKIPLFNAMNLSVNARETLRSAIETSVSIGNGFPNMSLEERRALQSALITPGLRGQALRAKVVSYKLLWYELLETLKLVKKGISNLLRNRIVELLALMKDLWASLIGPFPALEQIVEALGVLQQLFALSEVPTE